MKYIPNFLTVARIILSVCLLFTEPLSAGFYLIYLLCGLSDILDGLIARKFDAGTEIGARLDSAADFIFAAVVIVRLFPVIRPPDLILWWVGLIFIVRLTTAMVAKLCFGKLGFLHTYGNKLTGLLLFLYPLSLIVTDSETIIYALCVIATMSALEELIIDLRQKLWSANCKSVFQMD